MSTLIGNIVLLTAGLVLMASTAIGLSLIFVYVFAFVLLRRLFRGQPAALTAGADAF